MNVVSAATSFEDDQKHAAGLFAQTILVVDDEAIQIDLEDSPEPISTLAKPTRTGVPPDSANSHKSGLNSVLRGNRLDAKKLIEKSLDLGIVCSVLRVTKSDRSSKRLVKAARNADIVSLDWEVEGDGGELARDVIVGIVKSDIRQNGRVRLISIYTAMRNRQDILKKIRDKLKSDCQGSYQISDGCVTNKDESGAASLRIVCLLKPNGIRKTRVSQVPHEVDEQGLPEKLLSEFGKLSEGLLGNAAMATIASVRDVTHHVLKMFDGKMDGPYFQHRATIEQPHEAENYAIDMVLSEIKKSVIRKNITLFVNKEAIGRAISEKFSGADQTLTYRTKIKGGVSKETNFDLTEAQAIQLICDGLTHFSAKGLASQVANFNKKGAKKFLSTLFEEKIEDALHELARFASISQLGFQPHGHRALVGDLAPSLTTGTIIKPIRVNAYYICLQAICDTVRRTEISPFIFAKLTKVDEVGRQPVFVVPTSAARKTSYITLATESDAYTNLEYIKFEPEEQTEIVVASKIRKGEYRFIDVNGVSYKWLGNAKGRRSMRAAQSVAKSMERIGFDEFSPFSTDG